MQRSFSYNSSLRRMVVVTFAFLASCGDTDSFLQPAGFENVDRQYGLFALNGTPSGLPAGYQFTTESLVRPQVLGNGSLNFDVAFDITGDGKALVMPARRVVPQAPAGSPSIAFLSFGGAYEQLARAPEKGFVDDTTASLTVGQVLMIRLSASGCVYGEPLYAKLTVDSINVAQRRLLVRSLVNRNCGYRSLEVGIPKD